MTYYLTDMIDIEIYIVYCVPFEFGIILGKHSLVDRVSFKLFQLTRLNFIPFTFEVRLSTHLFFRMDKLRCGEKQEKRPKTLKTYFKANIHHSVRSRGVFL